MADSFGKLVVRAYAPKRRAVLWTLAALLIVGILYTAFELGRYDAGFRVVDSVRGALSASRRIRSLEAENQSQRRQLEAAETARRVDREGYAQVEKSLGDMQSQIARLNQDLSFYRGLVQPESLQPLHPFLRRQLHKSHRLWTQRRRPRHQRAPCQ